MRKWPAFLLLAALPLAPVQAQSMPAATFLAKAEALKKKGPLALLSSDFGRLKKEMTASGEALRAERLAAEKAGTKPAYCPPAKQTGMSPDEIIGHFRSIPPAQLQRMQTKDALRSLLAKKYPCPA